MSDTRIPFMPPLNSFWRFKSDFALLDIADRYGNGDTFQCELSQWPEFKDFDWSKGQWEWTPAKHEAYDKWKEEQLARYGGCIPAGTVVSFNRYHASNSGDVQMTLQFYSSPNPFLTPKKRGGKGKGPMRFYINLDQFNLLGEMEAVDVQNP